MDSNKKAPMSDSEWAEFKEFLSDMKGVSVVVPFSVSQLALIMMALKNVSAAMGSVGGNPEYAAGAEQLGWLAHAFGHLAEKIDEIGKEACGAANAARRMREKDEDEGEEIFPGATQRVAKC